MPANALASRQARPYQSRNVILRSRSLAPILSGNSRACSASISPTCANWLISANPALFVARPFYHPGDAPAIDGG
jgi:hypothetical protein